MKKPSVCCLALAASLCLNACEARLEPVPLRPDASVVTVINRLEAPVGSQERLIKLLGEGIGGKMRHRPGFVSATIHKSLDSEHVVVYAQWASEQALADASRFVSEGGAPAMLEAFALGAAEVNAYAVVVVHRAPPG